MKQPLKITHIRVPISNYITALPNPATDWVGFSYHLPTTNGRLVVTDIQGRKVYKTTLDNQEGQAIVSTQTWATGVYLYQLYAGDKRLQTCKLVIQK